MPRDRSKLSRVRESLAHADVGDVSWRNSRGSSKRCNPQSGWIRTKKNFRPLVQCPCRRRSGRGARESVHFQSRVIGRDFFRSAGWRGGARARCPCHDPRGTSWGRLAHCASNCRRLSLRTLPLTSCRFHMIKNLPSARQVTPLANIRFNVRRFESPHTRVELSQVIPAVLSWNAPSSDPWTKDIARRRRLIKGIRLLRRKINRVIHAERENAIIYRLLATRFPSDSNEASSLRLLGQRAMRRVKRLKGPLAELNEVWRPAPRTWGFYMRRLRALYTPRRWLCSREERKSKDRV